MPQLRPKSNPARRVYSTQKCPWVRWGSNTPKSKRKTLDLLNPIGIKENVGIPNDHKAPGKN